MGRYFRCTLCGQLREFGSVRFAKHMATQLHQTAVAEWDRRHALRREQVELTDIERRQRAMADLFGGRTR